MKVRWLPEALLVCICIAPAASIASEPNTSFTKIINTSLSQENLEHHKMARYLAQTERKAEQANLMPYETSIDTRKENALVNFVTKHT